MASGLSGPELDGIKEYLVEWYAKKRLELIEAFEEGYPYGSRPLSNLEQVAQFESKLTNPDSWSVLVASLYERYRGLPDASERVRKDLEDYIRQMRTLQREVSLVNG